MKIDLGRIKKIDNLREVWKDEATVFTKWLAEEKNIKMLSDELGISIVVDDTEASAGRYNADILAHEEDTDRTIVIENQLEVTNHDHLGKVVVYSSGLDAEIQIWVVKDVRDEHKQAVDWLNEHSDEHINIFLVKIELWKIDDSKVAPKFHIVSSPNNWAKTMRKSVKKDTSDTNIIHLNFWEGFKEYCEDKVKFSLIKPMPQHWYNVSIGSSECHVALTYNVPKREVACELYINNSKDLYYYLEQNKEDINKEISDKLQWMPLENRKASRIKLISPVEVDPNAENWNDAFEWMKTEVELFRGVFGKYLREWK